MRGGPRGVVLPQELGEPGYEGPANEQLAVLSPSTMAEKEQKCERALGNLPRGVSFFRLVLAGEEPTVVTITIRTMAGS